MEAVERTDVGDKTRALFLEYLPDRSISKLLVRVGLGPGNTAILEHPTIVLEPVANKVASLSSA